jgi:hypothetical protein
MDMAPTRISSAISLGLAALIASCSSASTGSRDAPLGPGSGRGPHDPGAAGAASFDNADPANSGTDASVGMHVPLPADRDAMSGGCGSSEFTIAEQPPNVMILLDRSASMDGDAGGDTRWNVAKKAIETLTAEFDDRVRFGLATYSSCIEGGCSAGAVVVPIAAHNGQAIVDFLATTVDERSGDGRELTDDGKIKYLCDTGDPETPTGKSLAALVGEKSLLDATRDNAVVLLTDGEENEECADECDGPCGAKRLLAQTPAVKTYVIGLGVNPDDLDAIAAAGDTEHAIGTADEHELSDAFGQVARAVASCDYAVEDQAQDGTDLYVFFNNDPKPLERSDDDGWSFDAEAHRLRFHGDACTQIETGSVKDIDVVYGCPKPTVD